MEAPSKSYSQKTRATNWLATTSVILGILAVLPFTYAWLFALMTWVRPSFTWFFGLTLVIVFHIPVVFGFLFGLLSLIVGKEAGKVLGHSKTVKVGTSFGKLGILLDILYLEQFYMLGIISGEGGPCIILWLLTFRTWVC